MIDSAELAKRFEHHPPKDEVVAEDHAAIRYAFKVLASWVVDNTPPSREQSLALTHLEEAMFWANAAIARNN